VQPVSCSERSPDLLHMRVCYGHETNVCVLDWSPNVCRIGHSTNAELLVCVVEALAQGKKTKTRVKYKHV